MACFLTGWTEQHEHTMQSIQHHHKTLQNCTVESPPSQHKFIYINLQQEHEYFNCAFAFYKRKHVYFRQDFQIHYEPIQRWILDYKTHHRTSTSPWLGNMWMDQSKPSNILNNQKTAITNTLKELNYFFLMIWTLTCVCFCHLVINIR